MVLTGPRNIPCPLLAGPMYLLCHLVFLFPLGCEVSITLVIYKSPSFIAFLFIAIIIELLLFLVSIRKKR